MTKLLREAISAVEALPDDAQDGIARELLDHVGKLRALRADIGAGLRSLDAGEGRELDIERVIAQARRGGR